jgi:hypothetical protein
LHYKSTYPHIRSFFRIAPQYSNQVPIINGRRHGKDVNLFKLFTEQCFNLLQTGGTCGIVVPTGIYSDLGAKKLRQMLFEETEISGLFSFENRKAIFEGVDSRFKFVVLSFEKGGQTRSFPAAFMRHDVAELERFPNDNSFKIDIDFIARSSPDSLSITEFKNDLDFRITEKILQFPFLSEDLPNTWNLELHREFNMTDDDYLFHKERDSNMLPLYEGKMIWQFSHLLSAPRNWVNINEGRKAVLGKRGVDRGQLLGYQKYRFAYRSIASSTNERSFVATVIPPAFTGNSLNVSESLAGPQLLVCVSLANSFITDWVLRQKVAANINMFYVYQLPVPRLQPGDRYFDAIVRRAAQLICTAPEYDDLAAQVGLGSHHNGVTDPDRRAKLRAELDGMIAHIYGLTEDEFAYVLSTFPLVAEPVKMAALAAYRDVARGLIG